MDEHWKTSIESANLDKRENSVEKHIENAEMKPDAFASIIASINLVFFIPVNLIPLWEYMHTCEERPVDPSSSLLDHALKSGWGISERDWAWHVGEQVAFDCDVEAHGSVLSKVCVLLDRIDFFLVLQLAIYPAE